MKKFLLGTTSLVAVGVLGAPDSALAAADPLHLEVDGYYRFYGMLADEDQEGGVPNASITTMQDAEVNFQMRGELDNGLKIGGRMELEGSQNGDQIDQHWVTLEGGWGRLDLGALNSGRYNMTWGVAEPNVGLGINSGFQSHYMTFNSGMGGQFRRPFRSANHDAANDDHAITYWTPKFNGFRLALTYRPRVSTTTSGGTGGANPGRLPNKNTDYHDAFDIGVEWGGKLGDVGVNAVVGAGFAGAPNNAKNAVANGGTKSFSDYEQYGGGLKIKWQGFQVGGMISTISDGMCVDTNGDADCADAADQNTEGTAWSLGAQYGQGPWAVSISYFDGEQEDTIGNVAESTHETWALSASYTLGPGVRALATYQNVDETDETRAAASGNDADAFILGVVLGF